MGCGRRWILFGSDFRTQTDISFSPPFMGCGPAMDIFWVRFSDPNWFFFQSTIYGLWPGDGYLLGPIFGPKLIFLPVHHLWVVARRWIFFESDFWTPIFSFQSTIYGLWPTMDTFWVRFSNPNWFFFQSTIYGLWPDDRYFLNPIFGPQFILFAAGHQPAAPIFLSDLRFFGSMVPWFHGSISKCLAAAPVFLFRATRHFVLFSCEFKICAEVVVHRMFAVFLNSLNGKNSSRTIVRDIFSFFF